KSTTMRLILGLDAPDAGMVTINGRPYASYRRPLLEAGARVGAKAVHRGGHAPNPPLFPARSPGGSRGPGAGRVGGGGVARGRPVAGHGAAAGHRRRAARRSAGADAG